MIFFDLMIVEIYVKDDGKLCLSSFFLLSTTLQFSIRHFQFPIN
jgi:hypothetical protein